MYRRLAASTGRTTAGAGHKRRIVRRPTQPYGLRCEARSSAAVRAAAEFVSPAASEDATRVASASTALWALDYLST